MKRKSYLGLHNVSFSNLYAMTLVHYIFKFTLYSSNTIYYCNLCGPLDPITDPRLRTYGLDDSLVAHNLFSNRKIPSQI